MQLRSVYLGSWFRCPVLSVKLKKVTSFVQLCLVRRGEKDSKNSQLSSLPGFSVIKPAMGSERGSATAEKFEMEEGEPMRKPRTRSNSVASHASSTVSSAHCMDVDGFQCPASPASSTKSSRGGGKKDSEVRPGQIAAEGLATPTTPKAASRIRRNSKSEIESVLETTSFQNVTESPLVCPPSPSSFPSATGRASASSQQSPVVGNQESKATSGRVDSPGGDRGGRKAQQPRTRRKRGTVGGKGAGVTYDDLDFHTSWFASMSNPHPNTVPLLFGPYLEAVAGVKELPNMPPNYLSRDLMLQLTCNLNNGLAYIDHAFEAIRQGAQELCTAKVTLDRIYRNQQRNLDETLGDNKEGQDNNASNAADVSQGSDGADGGSVKTEKVSDQSISTSTPEFQQADAVAKVESFQVNVDPYQYLPIPIGNIPDVGIISTDAIIDDVQNAVIYGNGKQGQRRKREEVEGVNNCSTSPSKKRRKGQPPKLVFPSNYNRDLAMGDTQTLLNHLKATDAQHKGYGWVTVKAVDIRPTLDRVTCFRPNVFSTRKVLTDLKRKAKRMSRSANKSCGPTKSISRPLKKNKSLPEWRKLRAPPELMERIMRRIYNKEPASDSSDSTTAIPLPNEPPSYSVKTTDTNNNPNSIKIPAAPAQGFQSDTNDSEVGGSKKPKADNTESPSTKDRIIRKSEFKVAECEENNNTYEDSDTEEERANRTKKVFLPQFDKPLVAHSGYNDAKIDIPTINGNNLLNDYTDGDDSCSSSSTDYFQAVCPTPTDQPKEII